MILELIYGGAGAVIGAVAMRMTRRKDKRPQCGAYLRQTVGGNDIGTQTKSRCLEHADARCEARYCLVHCRQSIRCNGQCIRVHNALLELAP